MIDRFARHTAAEALEGFRSGVLTNDEFEDRWPLSPSDPALGQIMDQLWSTYGDTDEYRLDRSTIGRERDALYARTVLFLRSSLEYEWPLTPSPGIVSLLFSAATLGLGRVLALHRRRRFRRAGDVDFWPFIREQDFRSAGGSRRRD